MMAVVQQHAAASQGDAQCGQQRQVLCDETGAAGSPCALGNPMEQVSIDEFQPYL